jgi:hypothetical protein
MRRTHQPVNRSDVGGSELGVYVVQMSCRKKVIAIDAGPPPIAMRNRIQAIEPGRYLTTSNLP